MQDNDKLLMIFGGSFAAVVGVVAVIAIGFELYRRYINPRQSSAE